MWVLDKTSLNDFGLMTCLLLRHKKYNTLGINGVCLHALYFYKLSKAWVAWNTDLVSNQRLFENI